MIGGYVVDLKNLPVWEWSVNYPKDSFLISSVSFLIVHRVLEMNLNRIINLSDVWHLEIWCCYYSFTLQFFYLYPESLGHVNITSFNDLDALHDFDMVFVFSYLVSLSTYSSSRYLLGSFGFFLFVEISLPLFFFSPFNIFLCRTFLFGLLARSTIRSSNVTHLGKLKVGHPNSSSKS